MNSCVYEGWVRHRRDAPVENHFHYPLFMLYLDLSELAIVFRKRWLWSTKGANIAWFRREDHLGDPSEPLDDAVRSLVEEHTGVWPTGPIRLLTHLRYLGYAMNPVSFFYCWDPQDTHVQAIVAEVTNTPWGETHCYVLSPSRDESTSRKMRFCFDKEFHVSPFMGMQQTYDWRFAVPTHRILVHMENSESGRKLLDATLVMKRRPITGWVLARLLVRYPFMTGKVVVAIYCQALRLWLKRCPFYSHPKFEAEDSETS